MKTLISQVVIIVLSIHVLNAQNEKVVDYLRHLPSELTLDKSIPRSYLMTTDYYDYDLESNFLKKQRLTGVITYKGDSAQWRDVYSAESTVLNAELSRGERQDFMQLFTYKPGDHVLTPEFFQSHLPEANTFHMNLIWDALGFEALAYGHWNLLKLNEEFSATNMNAEMTIANIGTFENKDIKLTWLGITEMNNEICAILKYSVMNNPLKLEIETMSLQGRSHYWGEIYVSLADKQIEYVTLTEDVLMDVKFVGQEDDLIGYTIRNISLSKIQ